MKPVINLFARLLFLYLLIGCDKWDHIYPEERVAVEFSTGTTVRTKTTDGYIWSYRDSIGIFMVEKGEELATGSIVEGADNRKYIQYKSSGELSKGHFRAATGVEMYYPVDGHPVDFISYYPFTKKVTNYTYPVDVRNKQDKPEWIDVLYSNNAKGYSKNMGIRDSVRLEFRHMMSKLTFTLSAGNGAPDLANAKIKVGNLYQEADLNLADGEIRNLRTRGDMEVNPNMASLIVVPQQAEESILTITLPNEDNGVFEWKFPVSTKFESGNNYEYTIRVSKTGIEVTQGNIMGWNGKDDPPIEEVISP